MKQVLLLLSFILLAGWLFSEEYTDKIHKEVNTSGDLKQKLICFENLFGEVTVEGYNGNTIKFEISRKIEYENESELEKAKEELQLLITENNKGYIFYYNMPQIEIDEEDMNISFNFCGEELEYNFTYDVKILVPQNINLKISTIDKGDVHVERCNGQLDIGNINGSIDLKDVEQLLEASTVNGSIEIEFSENPEGESNYSTINGDVKLKLREDFSARVEFSSMNGDLYTDFNNIKNQTRQVEKTENKGKTRYEIKSRPVLQFGNGKNMMNFSSINGSFYLMNSDK